MDPAHQSRRAGSQLLQWGCEQADQLGVSIILESTPAGLPLYKRYGFQEMLTLRANMHDFGWEPEYDEEAAKRVYMIRSPKSQTAAMSS